MKEIIPGHALAYTIPGLVLMALCLYFAGESARTTGYTIASFAVWFLGDQATHIARHRHETLPSWIEKKMGRYPHLFQVFGAIGAVLLISMALANK